jgi:hypothetical protein
MTRQEKIKQAIKDFQKIATTANGVYTEETKEASEKYHSTMTIANEQYQKTI